MLQSIKRPRVRALLVVLALLAVGLLAGGVRWQSQTAPAAGQGAVSVKADPERERDTIGGSSQTTVGDRQKEDDLLKMAEYWQQRVTYPTGNYDPAWLLKAAAQDKLISSQVPGGRITYQPNKASPNGLSPTAWTSLGPQPLQSDGCLGCYNYGLVSGRVNDIAH